VVFKTQSQLTLNFNYLQMKRSLKTVLLTALAFGTTVSSFAGNPQRAGSAGATELLINPWARSSGMANSNIAGITGVESSFLNIAGIAHVEKTEVNFTNTQWLVGTGISINAFGLNQSVGNNGVLGLTVQAFDYGDIPVTTESSPEGTGATVSPSTIVLGFAYAQRFTQSIFGGVNIKVLNSNITNISATGLCFDAGVQYHTGAQKEWKFGISLRNVGPAISYGGDGMDLLLPVPQEGYVQTFSSRSAAFEIPAALSLGGSYDWFVIPGSKDRLTFAASFTSNSFEKDLFHFGLEYAALNEQFAVRAGYTATDDRFDNMATSAIDGFAAGFSVAAPLGKESTSKVALDFSYRNTRVFNGIYTVGARITL
jgi:hypothetical protein